MRGETLCQLNTVGGTPRRRNANSENRRVGELSIVFVATNHHIWSLEFYRV